MVEAGSLFEIEVVGIAVTNFDGREERRTFRKCKRSSLNAICCYRRWGMASLVQFVESRSTGALFPLLAG